MSPIRRRDTAAASRYDRQPDRFEMANDPDDLFPSGPTTRRGFLSVFGRRAAQALPDVPASLVPRSQAPAVDEEAYFDEEPPESVDPVLTGDELVEEVRASADESGLHTWWLGQAGVLFSVAGRTILVDPYLSDTLSDPEAADGATYERITGIPVAPDALSFVDVVVCTNGRPDHLDGPSLAGVLSGEATFVCASGTGRVARERTGRGPDHLLARDGTVEAADLVLTGIPAYSEGAPESIGVVIRHGAYSVYVAGDTRRVQGVAEAVAYWGVDLALLPVNGHGNMDGADAARLAYESLAPIAIPYHYEMFRHDTASPSRFVAECARIGQEYRLPRCGERVTVDYGY